MPKHSDHPDFARLPRMLRDLVAPSDGPAAGLRREPPVVATGLEKTLDLDFVVRLRDPNGRVAHFARGNAHLATLGDWLWDDLVENGHLSHMEIVPGTSDDAQGGGGSAESSYLVGEALTARERDILSMISQGLSNKRIARAFEISPETVKSHVKHIFLKLAVSTRAEAVSRAGSFGLLRGWARRSLTEPSS